MKKIIGIFAHPDDESYRAGGTIAKYVKAGWSTAIVCATRGEEGGRGAYGEMDALAFGEVRQKELEKAAAELGVTTVSFLDFKDNTLTNQLPGTIEDALVKLLVAEQPDVVITFEPSGVTHHPDHIKLSLAATFAFQKYAFDRESIAPEDLNPPKLYYACEPESIVSYFIKKKYYETESFGRPRMGVADKRITTVIDISRTASAKARALQAHVSQATEINNFLAIERNPFMSKEYFILRFVGTKEAFMGKNDRVSDRL